MDAIPYQIVLMTAANTEEAERIADILVEKGLAACVNMVTACRSVYRWQGKIVKEPEVLMIAKTHRGNFSKIESIVSEVHSYEVPEIIAVDLTAASNEYLGFLRDSLGD